MVHVAHLYSFTKCALSLSALTMVPKRISRGKPANLVKFKELRWVQVQLNKQLHSQGAFDRMSERIPVQCIFGYFQTFYFHTTSLHLLFEIYILIIALIISYIALDSDLNNLFHLQFIVFLTSIFISLISTFAHLCIFQYIVKFLVCMHKLGQ